MPRLVLPCLLSFAIGLPCALAPAAEPPVKPADQAAAATAAPSLAGSSYAITVVAGEDGGDKSEDELSFDEKNLTSKTYAEMNFVPGAYTASAKDGAVTFIAHLAHARGATAIVSGTIKGDAIEGTFVTTLRSGGATKATFSGTKK